MNTSRVLAEHQRAMRRRNLSPGTIGKRMSEVRRWCDHVGDPWSATRADLEEWLDARELGARSRYCSISHVHAFYVWAMREEHTDRDPTALVERPRLPRRLPRPARRSAVERAISEADPTMRLVLILMVDGGLRCCEVSRMSFDDVDLEAGVIRVRGKGDHERVIGIPQRLRLELLAHDGAVGPVTGAPRTAARVSQLVCQYLRSAGVTATAHQLRHLYGTRLYAATGGDLLAVQHALGHASVSTTQLYAQLDPLRAAAAAARLD